MTRVTPIIILAERGKKMGEMLDLPHNTIGVSPSNSKFMLHHSVLKRSIFSAFFLFLLCQNAFSQESRPFRYSDEIGIDFSPLLRGESGASLLYKHSLGQRLDVERRMQFSLRLLLGFYNDAYDSYTIQKFNVDTLFTIQNSGRSKHRFLSAGAELQARKKNFRFYLGADLGYRYWTSLGESQQMKQFNGTIFSVKEFDHETKANVVQASMLAGINYFFLPRFSIGLEANVSAAVEFSNSKVLQNGAVVLKDSGTLFEIDYRLFRLLYLSYHFGRPAQK